MGDTFALINVSLFSCDVALLFIWVLGLYLQRHSYHIIPYTPYHIHHIVIDPLLHKYRTSKSYKEATNPDRVAVLTPDMKRIRDKQQQVTIERSLQAAHEEKEKLKKEKERKRIKTPEEERWEKLGGEGNKLGDTTSRSNAAEVDGDGLRRRRRR